MNILKIFIAFALIVIIAISSAFFTIFKMNELSLQTKLMYTHPFRVSNAVAEIQTKVITIHRNMKDVVLTNEADDMLEILNNIAREEFDVYELFEIVYENYLGDEKDIDTSFKLFDQWKDIREDVVSAMLKGKVKVAVDITKNRGALHIENLYKQIAVLKTYAFNKAETFYKQAVENNGIQSVLIVFLVTLFISSIIVGFVILSLMKINRQNNKQLHLIDQNILLAKLDINKKIMEISSAFCRDLKEDKQKLLGHKAENFFVLRDQYTLFKNQVESAKEYSGEVSIVVEGLEKWYSLEVIPSLNAQYDLKGYSLIFTDISNKKIIEKVSITDALTGLHNRNYFDLIFDKEIKRAKRDRKDLGVLMFDIDYFKQFNDTYGHQEGDKALKLVADVLASHTNRSYDYAFRVGGEEFVLFTFRDTVEDLKAFAQAIINDVRELKIPHENSMVCDFVTLSCGAITFGTEHLLSVDEMYNKVDILLYKAKDNGRNQVQAEHIL